MSEFWSGSFATKFEFEAFIAEQAEMLFEPNYIWPNVHEDCPDPYEHGDGCISDPEEWAHENGWINPLDYPDLITQHDGHHDGSIKWCTQGMCVVFSERYV